MAAGPQASRLPGPGLPADAEPGIGQLGIWLICSLGNRIKVIVVAGRWMHLAVSSPWRYRDLRMAEPVSAMGYADISWA